jgi:glycosyltransferase involved in cell wall biosynthesis
VGRSISNLDFSSDIEVFDGVDYNNPISWWKACAFINRKQPQTVLIQWWTGSVAHMQIVLARAARRAGSKVVFEMHEVADPIEDGNPLLRGYSKLFGKLLLAYGNHFITHSESDRSLVSRTYQIDKENVTVIPHPPYDQYCNQIDSASAKRSIGVEEAFAILSFGLIRDYKGIPCLIEAFDSLPSDVAENSSLLIVGEIWESRNAITDAVRNSRYSERIRLVDEYVPDSDVPIYFSASDLVCLPYLRASQSGVAGIATAFGKPVIVSSVGGLTESMSNYEGTLFVPPGNSDAIAENITKVYNLWKSGLKTDFSPPSLRWENVVDLYEGVL